MTNGLFLSSAFRQIASTWRLPVGRVMSSYGTCQTALLYGHIEVPPLYGMIAIVIVLIRSAGHTDRVGGVAWHPQATLSQSEDAVNMVSGAADQTVNLWSLNRFVPHAIEAWICFLKNAL